MGNLKEKKTEAWNISNDAEYVLLYKDVKESVLDLNKYLEYKKELNINGKNDKTKEIVVYFKTKYNGLRLWEREEDYIIKEIFGDFEK